MRAVIVAVVALVATAAAIRVIGVAVSDDPSERSYVIVGDESVGGFRQDGTLAEAVEVLGIPTATETGYTNCTLTWRGAGIVMETFYSAGSRDPCGPEALHVSTTVTGERWTTDRGLRIGDGGARLRELYPKAEPGAEGVWVLKRRPAPGLSFPSLEAKVTNGRVVSLKLYGPRRVV